MVNMTNFYYLWNNLLYENERCIFCYMLILAHYHIILQTLGTFTNINSTKQNTVTTTEVTVRVIPVN